MKWTMKRTEHKHNRKGIIMRITGRIILTSVISILMLAGQGCGGGGGGGGGGGNNPPAPVPPDPWAVVTCSGCADPAPDTWLWAASETFHLKINGIVIENSDLEAFAAYPEVFFCLLQWNGGTSSYKRTSCADFTGMKPGWYNQEYFVWGGLGEFCLGDKWCSAGGPGYVEMYVDDGINAPWRVYAVPEVYPPYMI